MIGPWCWKNGALLPVEKACIPVDDINFAYGYGVYETLKVRKGLVFFPEYHETRLFHSARIIDVEHLLCPGDLIMGCKTLIHENKLIDANLKVLLIGGKTPETAQFWIMALSALFPDRKNYKIGGQVVTYSGERSFPQAKTLNMLISTLAYRKAQSAQAYDALLVNHKGEITEGTRTNFFWSDGEKIFTPPAKDVLEGVTKLTVCKTMEAMGIPWEEKKLHLSDLPKVKGCFLTSTSTKIMPLHKVDDWEIPLDPLITRLMVSYDLFLKHYAQDHFSPD